MSWKSIWCNHFWKLIEKEPLRKVKEWYAIYSYYAEYYECVKCYKGKIRESKTLEL